MRLPTAAAFLCAGFAFVAAAEPQAAARERMVRNHIAARGIKNADVLRAMRATGRHLFVPDHLRSSAYADQPLPIGYGATISQPYIVALMTEMLGVHPSHKVLEIGTGSGYQAAVLAQLCRHVYTIELEPELARTAGERLARLGYRNVTVRAGDGYLGWPEEAPFDRIILTAAPPDVPQALIAQLTRGGRLVAPVGELLDQELVSIDKRPDGSLVRRPNIPVRFVPMRRGSGFQTGQPDRSASRRTVEARGRKPPPCCLYN